MKSLPAKITLQVIKELCDEIYPVNEEYKFCIIDFRTVIHGTFNWTKAANYNKETISIDDNRATAEAFADEFIKLKRNDLN